MQDGEHIEYHDLEEWFEAYSRNPPAATLSLGNEFWFYFDSRNGSTFKIALPNTRDLDNLLETITKIADKLEPEDHETYSATHVVGAVEVGPANIEREPRGLDEVEVKELARIFSSAHTATDLFHRAALPAERLPAFGPGDTPERFWTAVGMQLEFGLVLNGRRALLAAAHELYPANPVFRRSLGM